MFVCISAAAAFLGGAIVSPFSVTELVIAGIIAVIWGLCWSGFMRWIKWI